MKYTVTIHEVVTHHRLVDAESPDEAVEKVKNGQGLTVSSPMFERTLDHTEWTVNVYGGRPILAFNPITSKFDRETD